ncbi:hypothetical protein [Streptomyces sp. NPDC004012]
MQAHVVPHQHDRPAELDAGAHQQGESGGAVLKLAVLPGNEPAIALYRRNGFIAAEELGDLWPEGITREHVMVKALRRA